MRNGDPGPDESSTTLRLRARGGLVLVVHDENDRGLQSWGALRERYILRDVTNGFDVLEWLARERQLVCVCVAGATVSSADFFRLISRVSLEHARRVVFISAPDDPDLAFLQAQHCHWLATPVSRDELLALVAAVSSA